MAHLAKVTGRPVKIMLPKDQELAQLQIKPETITNFRVGAKKNGEIIAISHEVFVSIGDLNSGVHADGPGNAYNQLELYTAKVPNWRLRGAPTAPTRSAPAFRAATFSRRASGPGKT